MPKLRNLSRLPLSVLQHVAISVEALALLYRRHEQHYFSSNGIQIHYTDEGRGVPVILVHGFAFNADFNWRIPGVVDELKKNFRVISLDLRGHGLSEKPHRQEAYGEELGRDIIRLMDYLEIPQAHLVGYSLGGFVAIKLMSTDPHRFLSVIPCAAGWDDLTPDTIELFGNIACALECDGCFNPLTERLEPGGHAHPLKHAAINFLLSIGNDTKALCNIFKTFNQLSVPQKLMEQNKVPVMAIVGMEDPLREQVEKMSEVTSNLVVCYVDDADHMSLAINGVFTELIQDFVVQNTPAVMRPRVSAN